MNPLESGIDIHSPTSGLVTLVMTSPDHQPPPGQSAPSRKAWRVRYKNAPPESLLEPPHEGPLRPPPLELGVGTGGSGRLLRQRGPESGPSLASQPRAEVEGGDESGRGLPLPRRAGSRATGERLPLPATRPRVPPPAAGARPAPLKCHPRPGEGAPPTSESHQLGGKEREQ